MASNEQLVELESLGFVKPRLNLLNDKQEIENLIENVKREYLMEYKAKYNE
jgi:hypothetical protein